MRSAPTTIMHGPIKLHSKGDGSGYTATCTLCDWETYGRDYVWTAQEKAQKHIEEKHERRTALRDRRGAGRPVSRTAHQHTETSTKRKDA